MKIKKILILICFSLLVLNINTSISLCGEMDNQKSSGLDEKPKEEIKNEEIGTKNKRKNRKRNEEIGTKNKRKNRKRNEEIGTKNKRKNRKRNEEIGTKNKRNNRRNKKRNEIEKNKRTDKANELQQCIDNFNTNKEIIDKLSEGMKKDVYRYIDTCETIKQEYIDGKNEEEFNNILNRCKEIEEEINKKNGEIEKNNRAEEANKKLQPYIDEFNANKEIIDQLPEDIKKDAYDYINRCETIKQEYIDGKNEEEFNNILNRCKEIEEEINSKNGEIEKNNRAEEANKKLQPYIDEFNANKEIIDQLPEDIKKDAYDYINRCETIKQEYIDGKNEEEFNNILNRCEVIKGEINSKNGEIAKNNREEEANKLQQYIDEFKKEKNQEAINQLPNSEKMIINNLETMKADYLDSEINEKYFEDILNRCEEIKGEINSKNGEIEKNNRAEEANKKLQPYIDEFNANKEIIDQLPEDIKKDAYDYINRCETIKQEYIDGKNEEEFNNILNRCEVIKGEINSKNGEIEKNNRAEEANKKLQPYIDEFNANKEIIDQLPEDIKKDAYDYINRCETIKQEYIDGKNEEEFNNILNRCKEIEGEINKKNGEINSKKDEINKEKNGKKSKTEETLASINALLNEDPRIIHRLSEKSKNTLSRLQEVKDILINNQKKLS